MAPSWAGLSAHTSLMASPSTAPIYGWVTTALTQSAGFESPMEHYLGSILRRLVQSAWPSTGPTFGSLTRLAARSARCRTNPGLPLPGARSKTGALMSHMQANELFNTSKENSNEPSCFQTPKSMRVAHQRAPGGHDVALPMPVWAGAGKLQSGGNFALVRR